MTTSPLETQIEQKLKNEIEKLDGLYYKFISPEHNGVPDRVVICRGQVFFVELKRPGEKPRRLQDAIHYKMRKRGAHVLVISNEKEIDSLVAYLKNKRNKPSRLEINKL